MKTPKPLLALRMVFPLAASLIVLLLGEGIARGSLSADVFASFIFPHIGAYLLAWLLLFLVWLLLDWVFRCPPLSTLGMAVLGCAPLSLIPISEPTRLGMISYAVFCLKKKTNTC